MELIFATANEFKVQEVKKILGHNYVIKGLKELEYYDELEENQKTFEGNSAQKAWFVYEKFKKDCFAEDAGLEVDALKGAPGVFSARYGGENKSSEENMRKVLKEMEGKKDRGAQFRTVIILVINRIEHQFEGVIRGTITEAPEGEGGFGYDPIFKPDGHDVTFAKMGLEEKNKISHRAIAFGKMVEFLNKQYAHLAP